jgi:hypothetical protein
VSLVALNGVSCARGVARVPAWGAPWVDLNCVEPLELAKGAAATVQWADVTISGVVASGGAYEGRAAYRIVGGHGGWNRELPAKAYANDIGCRASLVLSDAAAEAGETIADLPTNVLGPRYARAKGAASDALNLIAPRNWFVDFAGVTRIGQRAQSSYAGDAPRTRVDKNFGVIELATDSVAGLLPGVVVDGEAPATDVEYELEEGRMSVRVYHARRGDRFLTALERIIWALFPHIRYRGTYEFRVVTQSGERLNLQPVRVSSGFSELRAVPVRPGMAGLKAMVQPGELVLVTFADADPSRPQVISHDAPDAPGWMPLTLELGGPGALGVARLGDTVQAGPYAGIITGASARIKAAL